jgi:lysine 2,3-aminomutase
MLFKRKSPPETYDILGTEVINNDVFRDRFDAPPRDFRKIPKSELRDLWISNPDIYEILRNADDLESARNSLFVYLDRCENKVFQIDNELHIMEKATVRESVRVFKSIIGPINERRTEVSALSYLYRLAKGSSPEEIPELRKDFIVEFIHLFRAVTGLSGVYSTFGIPELKSMPEFISRDGREAALLRSNFLDGVAAAAEGRIGQYVSGLEPNIIKKRHNNRNRILKFFGGSDEDWKDHRWHLKHVIRDANTLAKLVDLTSEERKSIELAEKYRIPFGITPYYASLMDKSTKKKADHAVRAQVIPPLTYSETFAEHKAQRHQIMDFMGEHDTSPIDLITRRYPEVLIIKPYNSCSQICVYCQRNWEIEGVMDPKAVYPRRMIDEAINWIREHPAISDVLITGGDPFVLSDATLKHIIGRVAAIKHVRRIRIGTRTPVALPFRITDELVDILRRHVVPGKREVCVVTHIEHPYEITPDTAKAVSRLRQASISVYNQQVFTFENSRRFETVALRRALRLIGVDPYYTFITKGKEETDHYRVPIARILQERKEEARLFPGLDRTDEPVFNVPRLGKNHLRSWQDHRLIMILPDGRRVYEFHPWEKFITPIPPYNYIDVSIYGYLHRLKEEMGEDISEYKSIWYYY